MHADREILGAPPNAVALAFAVCSGRGVFGGGVANAAPAKIDPVRGIPITPISQMLFLSALAHTSSAAHIETSPCH
jgi:hypothetical protein